MAHPNLVESEEALAAIVRSSRTVAVLGMKDDPQSPAFEIPQLMQKQGFKIIPVNPKLTRVLGEQAHPDLASIGSGVDVVDVFRRSEAMEQIAGEILALPGERRPKVVWMQTGVRNDLAAERLAAAGIKVVQDRCLGVYVSRYGSR